MAIPMISTAVTDVDSPHAEAIFASAAHDGVRRIKLGYWPYEPFGTLAGQLDEVVRPGRSPREARPEVSRPPLRPLPLGPIAGGGRLRDLPDPPRVRAR